jgi:hypothetical protein
VSDSCEHSNKSSVSIKDRESDNQVTEYRVLKKDSFSMKLVIKSLHLNVKVVRN